MSFDYVFGPVAILAACAFNAWRDYQSERSSAAAPDGCRPRPYRQHPRRGVAGTARDGDYREERKAQ